MPHDDSEVSAAWLPEGFLQANGKALEYACWGPAPADTPTLFLLHEGLGCIRLWRAFPAALASATGFGVVAYSRAGYGQSDPADMPRPLDYMTREAIDVLPLVLDALDIRQAVTLGHSDGATIAAIHAGTVDDDRIKGTVLMAPHFFTEPMGLTEIAAARDAFAKSPTLAERMAKYHRDPEHTFRGWNDSWLHPQFTVSDASESISGIRVPVLAIQGREDQYGTLAQIDVLEKSARVPVQRLILDDCRHAPHLEQAQAVVAAIAGFCRTIP
ncbi:MAG: alpha/beta fold hydrolase [Granulosicoccus sp.]